MRIAEAAGKIGVQARLLRYYEDQGLLRPARTPSGHRDYSDADLVTARRIRQLLAAGLSTATIGEVLPCLAGHEDRLRPLCPQLVSRLRAEQEKMTSQIEALTASRDAIGRVIADGLGQARP